MKFIYPDFTTSSDLNEVELFVDNGSRKRVKRKIEYKSSLSDEMYEKIKLAFYDKDDNPVLMRIILEK